MKTKYNEIFKLKKMLEKEKIPFEWIESFGYDKKDLQRIKQYAPDLLQHYQICYPVFDSNNRTISVIEGFGTYGSEQDRLEIMGLLTEEEKEHNCVARWSYCRRGIQ